MSSSVITVSGASCNTEIVGGQSHAYCGIPQGTAFPVATMVGVYFDFLAEAGTSRFFYISKSSASGAAYSDYISFTPTTSGASERFVSAFNVKQNPSTWDYLLAGASWPGAVSTNIGQVFGVGAVNSN